MNNPFQYPGFRVLTVFFDEPYRWFLYVFAFLKECEHEDGYPGQREKDDWRSDLKVLTEGLKTGENRLNLNSV